MRLVLICGVCLALVAPAGARCAGNTDEPAVEGQLDGSAAALALAYYQRGLALRDKAWELERRAVDSRRAERLLTKARARWTSAVVAYREAVANDPTLDQAFGSLGYALRRLGSFDESLEAYDRALELAPDYVEAIEYRAETYLGLTRLDEVREAYMELFRLDRAQAGILMAAMQDWIEARRASGETSAAVQEFSAWVADRAELAGQTEALTAEQGRSW